MARPRFLTTLRALRGPRFSKRSLLTTYLIVAATWLTGVAWLLLHYFMQQKGDFGPVPHPLEGWALKAHGAAAFAFLWLAGMLWSSHVTPAWRRNRRPASGIVLLSLIGLLIVTGYLLYYLGDDFLRSRAVLIHWAIGLLLPIALLLHRSRSTRREPGARRRESLPHQSRHDS